MDKGFTTSSLAVGVGIGVVIGWFLRGKLRRLSPVVSNNSRNTEVVKNVFCAEYFRPQSSSISLLFACP
jgi:hypothetical protein